MIEPETQAEAKPEVKQNAAQLKSHSDTFQSYFDLAQTFREGKEFEVQVRRGASDVLVIAPHGGTIEPGTDLIADVLAADRHSLYSFLGLIEGPQSWDLHVTSAQFDEPRGTHLVSQAQRVLSVHCCQGAERCVYMGGLDRELVDKIAKNLKAEGIRVAVHQNKNLHGVSPRNICNRGKSGKGVQLEISRGLIESFGLLGQPTGSTGAGSLEPQVVSKAEQNSDFERFISAIRRSL